MFIHHSSAKLFYIPKILPPIPPPLFLLCMQTSHCIFQGIENEGGAVLLGAEAKGACFNPNKYAYRERHRLKSAINALISIYFCCFFLFFFGQTMKINRKRRWDGEVPLEKEGTKLTQYSK